MKEARARNPEIKLYGLSWGAPGWIGDGNYFSKDNLDYHIKWLKGAKEVHGLDIEYMGIWNEHAAESDWIVQLRQAMDDAGFASTAIVATDQGGWPICDEMVANETLRDAVAVIGSHYPEQGVFTGVGKKFPQAQPTPASCQELNEHHNKSLWTSEGWNLAYVDDWAGGLNLASTVNRNYVLQNQTAMVVWNLIYSWYSILPFAHPYAKTVAGQGHGLMTAAEPWSGHYSLEPPLFAMMHTTQFTRPGICRYLDNAGISSGGWMDSKNLSTIVAFTCEEGGKDWITIVVETSGLNSSLTDTTLRLAHLPAGGASSFDVWRTCEGDMFRNLGKHALSGSALTMTFEPACVYTLVSSDAGLGAPISSKTIPASQSFPNTWSDDFEGYRDQQTVKYFTDESGSFNAAKLPGVSGMVLQQVVPRHPINGAWWGNSEPYSLLGNSQNWTDTTVEVSAMIMGDTGSGSKAVDGYVPLSGALAAGNDLGTANLTWHEAVEHCNKTKGCSGFTFESAIARPSTPIKIYFKNASSQPNTDGDWRTWVRQSSTGHMPAAQSVKVCARISTFKPDGEPPQGYCLVLDSTGAWFLVAGGKAGPSSDLWTVLASGKTKGGAKGAGGWHKLQLKVAGSTLTGTVDGETVGSTTDASNRFAHGMIAIGSGWHEAAFDNFSVSATTRVHEYSVTL